MTPLILASTLLALYGFTACFSIALFVYHFVDFIFYWYS
jgi:hypothetical protein